VLHGLKRYPRSPGGGSTPWDNQVYGWFQDVVSSSAPATFELVAEPTPGARTYRVYYPATLTALFAADPTLSVAPTPGAGPAGMMVVQT
jgi:hypothetical protein